MPTDATPAPNARLAAPGERKVKYFGKDLPPKCALRACWLTDDGQHYYCTDFTCNRHKYRRTKHDRYSRWQHLDPARAGAPAGRAPEPAPPPLAAAPAEPQGLWPLVPFKCPRCGGADLQMRLLQNRYECSACQFLWR